VSRPGLARIEQEEAMPYASRSSEALAGPVTPRRFGRLPAHDMKQRGSKTPKTKAAPPEQTNAENFYYLKQMNAKTPMVIILTDGEEIRGWIEWYDRGAIKVNREGAPNLLIQKHCIKYLFKEDELL
jgi:host factor-I protein